MRNDITPDDLKKMKLVHSAELSGLRCVSERTLCRA